jgi:hypothetical protein
MHNSRIFLEVSAALLRRGYWVRFRAHGQSMQPTIREGEAITVAPVLPSQVTRGDVLLYRAARGVTAHRVVDIAQRKGKAMVFVLGGDASVSCDDPVESWQILGKVVSVERDGRRLTLDGRKARVLRKVRRCACRLKEWMVSNRRSAISRQRSA